MIKAHGHFGEHPFILVGLSQANIDKLLDSQPILIDTRELAPQLPSLIIITAGATESSILADVQENFGRINELRWV